MEQPEVRYARSGDVAIAYYVVGDGRDLVFAPLTLSMVFAWHLPVVREFCLRLASFSRLILFDKRGIGASDRPRTPPTLGVQMEDVRAVPTRSAPSRRRSSVPATEGRCALFAASYPERTTALVLYASRARVPGTPDEHRAILRRIRDEFGTKEGIERGMLAYPSLAQDAEFAKWMP